MSNVLGYIEMAGRLYAARDILAMEELRHEPQ